jgi:hypothetical protein
LAYSLTHFPQPGITDKIAPVSLVFCVTKLLLNRESETTVAKRPVWSRLIGVAGVVLWFGLIATGLVSLSLYEHAAGAAAVAPAEWPRETRLKPTPGRATLVIVTHPKCPCTVATLEELDDLMAHSGNKLTTYLLLAKPQDAPPNWEYGDISRKALTIPGVTVVVDHNETEAKYFGAATSGQVLLYGPDGHLLFAGGITASRGHAGDNAGRFAIESLLETGRAETNTTNVYGCPLFNPDNECRNHTNEKPAN